MAHDIEISFFAGKKSENFCAGSITERRTRKVIETQKNYDRLQLGIHNSLFGYFLKRNQVRANSWTITKFRDLCKLISASFCEIVI